MDSKKNKLLELMGNDLINDDERGNELRKNIKKNMGGPFDEKEFETEPSQGNTKISDELENLINDINNDENDKTIKFNKESNANQESENNDLIYFNQKPNNEKLKKKLSILFHIVGDIIDEL